MRNQSKKFLETVRFLLEAREIVLNNFKSNVFSIENLTPDPTFNLPLSYTPKHTRACSKKRNVKISPFRMNEDFANEIRNDEENINSQIFREYFVYQNPSLLAKVLIKANQVKNNQIANQAINSINKLRNVVIRKEIPENENPNKIIAIVEKKC